MMPPVKKFKVKDCFSNLLELTAHGNTYAQKKFWVKKIHESGPTLWQETPFCHEMMMAEWIKPLMNSKSWANPLHAAILDPSADMSTNEKLMDVILCAIIDQLPF